MDSFTKPIAVPNEHRLIFTRHVFAPDNTVLADLLTPREPGGRARAVIFWDGGLEFAFPGIDRRIAAWFKAQEKRIELLTPPVALPGGETVKNDFQHLQRGGRTAHPALLEGAAAA